jgi:bifunctional ADP-heptose synthase (sugar kinase/adenylyltransferase)
MGDIVTRDELVSRIAAQAAGKTIALANGCFDAHVAHVRYRAEAVASGLPDRGDQRRSVGRADQGEASGDAARIARSWSSRLTVDFVVLFDEPDVAALIQALRPDVHCKGTDYTTDSVPERDVVRGYGGRGDRRRSEGSFDADLIARFAR